MRQSLHSNRTARSIFGHDCPIAPKIIRAPFGIVNQWIGRKRSVGICLHIRCEVVAIRQNSAQFSLHFGHRGLDFRQPREFIALVKLPLRQAWKIKAGRLLQIKLLSAKQHIDCSADPAIAREAGLFQPVNQVLFKLDLNLPDKIARTVEHWVKSGGHGRSGRGLIERGLKEGICRAVITHPRL